MNPRFTPHPAGRDGRRRRKVVAVLIATCVILTDAVTAIGRAAATPTPAAVAAPAASDNIDTRLKVAPALVSGSRTFTAFVRTSGLGALSVDATAKGGSTGEGKPRSAAATNRVRAITATTRSIAAQAKALEPKASVIYSTAYTVPGVALVASASTFRSLAARRDVLSIVPLVPKSVDPKSVVSSESTPDGVKPTNAYSDVLTQAVKTWTQTKHTGEGINVAVIDTGVDYTHADFGGPGTRDAYQSAGQQRTPQVADYDARKYLGGYDFAGRTYNANDSSPQYDPFPQPDDNPLDGPGGAHGTHVAGSIGGYGVTADGSTFRGDYTTLIPSQVTSMKIGPGTAPGVGIYALKVFGDYGGSTNLTGAALDWVGEALTRGVAINVINLSLGSDYGVPDDPDNAKIDSLLEQGVVPVIAQGNAGDLTDIGGSPGNAASALTVAAATNGHSQLDGVNVVAPQSLSGRNPYAGQYSQNYIMFNGPVQGTVATLTTQDNLTGCAAFSEADRTRVAGKIAWLQWDDSNVTCGSATRFDNAQAAGAIGVVLTGTKESFDNGIAGNYGIPGIELTKTSVSALQPAAEAGTLTLEFRPDLYAVINVDNPETADQIADFSSRGEHGSYSGIVKPDVSAPGVNIVSAGAGTGNGSLTYSGTSMATPITAGITALAFQAHPAWTATEIKADIMNTATHDVTDNGVVTDNLRQGAGRVDALQAVNNNVTVTAAENGALVTASFGVLEISKPTARTRTLIITNRGATAQTYDLAYRARVTQPGVAFSLSSSVLTVPARGRATVALTLTVAQPNALRRIINPTQAPTQQGHNRDFVAAASGIVSLTPTGSNAAETPSLRLPVFAAPKPVSALVTRPITFPSASATTTGLRQDGRILAQGSGSSSYAGALAPFILGATSPTKAFPAGSSATTLAGLDLIAVGAVSTAPSKKNPADGVLAFGIKTRGPVANPGAGGYPVVDIDADGDGQWDFQTFVSKLQDSDVAVAVTTDIATGALVDTKPLNENLDGTYANVFNSSVAVLPVSLARLGYTRNTTLTTLTYRVRTESPLAPTAATGNFQVDATPSIKLDVFRPSLWFSGISTAGRAIVFPDTTVGVTVHRTRATAAQVLALHLGNAVPGQANILAVHSTPTLRVSVTLTGTPQVGRQLRARTSGWNTTGVTAKYQWLRDGRPIAGATTASRTVTRADLRHVLSVRVVGSKSGWNPVSATSTGSRIQR